MKQETFSSPIVKRRRKDFATADDVDNAVKGGSSGNYWQVCIDSLERISGY
jgi:hypothetical protein